MLSAAARGERFCCRAGCWPSPRSPSRRPRQRSWPTACHWPPGRCSPWAGSSSPWRSSSDGDFCRREGAPATSFAPRVWWRDGFPESASTCSQPSSSARRWATPTPSRRSWRGPTSWGRMRGPKHWTPATWWMLAPRAWRSSWPWQPWRSSASRRFLAPRACGRCGGFSGRPKDRAPPPGSPLPGTSSSPTATPPTWACCLGRCPARAERLGPPWGRWWSCGRAPTVRWHRPRLLVNGASVPLLVEHGRDLSGSLVVRKSGTYAVAFYGRTGRELARGPDVPLTAEPDAPPKVSLLLPASDLEVDADGEVVLRWEATDDYGLTSLALLYQKPAGAETRVPAALRHRTPEPRDVALGVGPAEAFARGPRQLLPRGVGQQRRGRGAEGHQPHRRRSTCTAPPSTARKRCRRCRRSGSDWWDTSRTAWRARTARAPRTSRR